MVPAEKKGKKVARPRKAAPDTAEKAKQASRKQSLKRPSTGENNQNKSASAGVSKRQKKTQRTPQTSSSTLQDRDEGTPLSEERASSTEPEYILAEITTVDSRKNRTADNLSADPQVDYKLVTTILHEIAFKKKKTRITKDAVKLFAKYIESFASEAVGRSIEEKRAINTAGIETSDIRTEAKNNNYLEVEQPLLPPLL
ncbi:hypothetical protein MferCBS31731_006005 [Microsporum ferrugineum]